MIGLKRLREEEKKRRKETKEEKERGRTEQHFGRPPAEPPAP